MSLKETEAEDIAFAGNVLDLLKEVRGLEAENAKLKEERRWISVENALPKIDRRVLCINSLGLRDVAIYDPEIWSTFKGKETEITHWMPLPEGPEEKE